MLNLYRLPCECIISTRPVTMYMIHLLIIFSFSLGF